ncbi:MAG: PmoA family protein [Bryobacter sp.]|nr:PmoA family protein [Bryobacter sp.]
MRYFTLLALSALLLPAQVKLSQAPDRIRIEINGQHFSDFFTSAAATKPYLHPLRTATGQQVSRSFPMDLVEGERRDHPHHRGLWFTHGDVNGYDFWANEKTQKGVGKGRGEVRTVKVNTLKSGKKSGTLTTTHEWIDGTGTKLLTELRTMTFYADPQLRTIDFDFTLTAATEAKFGDTKEGFFAIRLLRALEEESGGKMTRADGVSGEKQVWGSASPWVDYSGFIDGQPVGITIMEHPSSLRHPTYWHSRAYGLFAANPFGLHDFKRDKTADGSLVLKPGESARFRYRVIIHPGDTATFNPAEHFKKYAAMKLK